MIENSAGKAKKAVLLSKNNNREQSMRQAVVAMENVLRLAPLLRKMSAKKVHI